MASAGQQKPMGVRASLTPCDNSLIGDRDMLTLEEFRLMQPEDASCRSEDFKMWHLCPDDCPYNTGEACSLVEVAGG